MIWFLFILLIVLLLMAGAGRVVLLVLVGFAAVMAVGIVVHVVRQFTNPAYRAEVERNAEKRKSEKAQKRGRHSSFDKRREKFFDTGDIRYLLNENFKRD